MVLATELRNSVYQAAMQGKLTRQLETDGNVDELLFVIANDRNELFESGKIDKPIKILPINETEIPFDIPDSWRWVRWSMLSNSIQYGYNAPAQTNGDALMVRISDINNNEIMWENVPYCSIDESLKDKYTLCENDLLFARTGGTVGKTVLAKNVPKNTVFAGYLIRSNYNARLNPQYLKYFMESELYWKQLRNGTTQTAQPNCNGKTLAKMLIPLPPIEEQQRIVDRVNELMEQIDEYAKIEQQLISLKESFPGDLCSAILQAAMQGKLTEQLDTDSSVDELIVKKTESESIKKRGKKSAKMDIETFDIPYSWRWTKLSECGTTNIGLTYSPKDVTTAKDGTVVLRSSNIQNGKMDYADIVKVNIQVPEKKKCHIGDILICARNGSKRLVGKTAIIDREGNAFGAFMAIYRSACNPYIYYVLNSPHFRKSVLGGAETTTINQVTQDMVENYMFPLPPIEEQERIVKRLEELLPMCEGL